MNDSISWIRIKNFNLLIIIDWGFIYHIQVSWIVIFLFAIFSSACANSVSQFIVISAYILLRISSNYVQLRFNLFFFIIPSKLFLLIITELFHFILFIYSQAIKIFLLFFISKYQTSTNLFLITIMIILSSRCHNASNCAWVSILAIIICVINTWGANNKVRIIKKLQTVNIIICISIILIPGYRIQDTIWIIKLWNLLFFLRRILIVWIY